MSILIKKAKIIDPCSEWNGKTKDILIENGKIAQIGSAVSCPSARKVEFNNLHVSPGWFDMHVNFRDPGYEYKEDIQSGMRAAMTGGFTGVALMPSTLPCIDSKPQVEYILKMAAGNAVDVYPVGAISVNRQGVDITEMYDMHLAGAVAFSDDKNPLTDTGLLQRALLYSKVFNGLIISFPYDKGIAHNGMINESENTVMLGIHTSPSLAEELMVERDLSILKYTGGHLHFSTISSARSVALIRKGKEKGLSVSCEVAAHQIALDDSLLASFDSNYKVMPPLRTRSDINALTEGLLDGTIDAICSDHSPEDTESKKLEFDRAAFGIIGMETAFAVINTTLGEKVQTEQLVSLFSHNPRKIFGLPQIKIKKGETANLTLFDPGLEWTFTEKHIASKSSNTPFIGSEFRGKALGIYNNRKLHLNRE